MADGQSIGAQKGVLGRKIALARARSLGLGGENSSDQMAEPQDLAGDLMDVPALDGAAHDGAAASSGDPHVRAWRLALARAARDQLKMSLGFAQLTQAQVSLNEVLETPMQRALILMLQGAGDGMGLMIISGQMLAAMVEILTLTHLTPEQPDTADLRKPTRTDAAMAVEFVDAALSGFEGIVSQSVNSSADNWALGYRYAAFIEDPRPLHLMLEEGDYHLLAAELALEDGARKGNIWLALPAITLPTPIFDFGADDMVPDPPHAALDDNFSEDLAAQLQGLPVTLNASLAQISLPLQRLMSLQVGEVFPLPFANLDVIMVQGLDTRPIGRARLGQNRGMRALRITDIGEDGGKWPRPAPAQGPAKVAENPAIAHATSAELPRAVAAQDLAANEPPAHDALPQDITQPQAMGASATG